MRVWWLWNGLLALLSAMAYIGYYVPSDQNWVFGLATYLTLPLLLAHLLVVTFWLLKRKNKFKRKRAWLSGLMLVLGWPHLESTLQVSFSGSDAQGLRVLSYNVRVFNLYQTYWDKDPEKAAEVLDWVLAQEAEVLCFQEYYENSTDSLFDLPARMAEAGYPYHHIVDRFGDGEQRFGQAIYSRLPVVSVGTLDFHVNSGNKAQWMDVVWQEDTVRIYNLHLESMALSEDEVLATNLGDQEVREEKKRTLRKLRAGQATRSRQARQLDRHLSESPHPVIVTGDFNEMPYGHVYHIMHNQLTSAFEEDGAGFGFTYNGRLFFLRIDHQFFDDERLELLDFKTLRSVKHSDHYPILGTYQVR